MAKTITRPATPAEVRRLYERIGCTVRIGRNGRIYIRDAEGFVLEENLLADYVTDEHPVGRAFGTTRWLRTRGGR